jgi:ABC-type uncharacterized transport system ATPase subunit
VALRGISKRYGSLLANDRIDLAIRPGEIHALLGENGAGKSTLVKILYGVVEPSAGEIVWQNRPVAIRSPVAARALGLGMVFQHFSLFDEMTVAENVAVALSGDWTLPRVRARLEEVSAAYGLALEPDRAVWTLSAGERQRIEIVRCLLQNPKLLILDEPTSVLTPQEAESLFGTLERLSAEGCAILYISHKLDEVRRLCGSATILRAGRVVATLDPRERTAREIAALMVGADVTDVRAPARSGPAFDILRVRNLSLAPASIHGMPLKDIDLTVEAGEIVGVAGVAGNGQSELFAALSGERLGPPPEAVWIEGHSCGHLGIEGRRHLRAAFVPEERLGHATAPRFTLSNNVLISGHAASPMVRRGFIDRGQALAFVERITKAYDVRKAKADPEAMSLSGGNLQKYVVGREILREPRLLIVSQPTWGVDAGAAAAIRQAIIDLASRGAAVLVMSQDLDELYEISDRLVVICAGRLSAPRATRRADRGEIGMLMAGVGMKGAANAARA